MLELNKVHQLDVLEGLKAIDDNSIDLIITSPPYNKCGFNGKHYKGANDFWNKTINYGGDIDIDNMPEDVYEEWQIAILNECFRVLKPNGSMFYNHKLRVRKNQASFPLDWINKSKFIFRQLITWDRSSSVNLDKCRYVPCTEYLFWLIKERKNPRFKRLDGIPCPTEVWKIAPEKNNPHPAPFPITIPDNIIPCVAQGEKIVVLDPFMGSGTTAVSAALHDCDWIGFDMFEEYCQMTHDRVEKALSDKEKMREN